jgi:hypothetical protein
MKDKRQLIPITGLVVTIALATYMVVQASGQGAAGVPGDFTNAAVAEVKDAQGNVVLQGQFDASDEEDDDVERKAILQPSAGDGASGDAEVEFARSQPATQEVEFAVRGLQAGATFTFVIDGHEIATATTNQRGNAEVDVEVRMPAAPAR